MEGGNAVAFRTASDSRVPWAEADLDGGGSNLPGALETLGPQASAFFEPSDVEIATPRITKPTRKPDSSRWRGPRGAGIRGSSLLGRKGNVRALDDMLAPAPCHR
jgi:hypothetical protein